MRNLLKRFSSSKGNTNSSKAPAKTRRDTAAVIASALESLEPRRLFSDVFLQGKYVEVGIHDSGSFGTATAAPSGYHATEYGLGFVADVGKDGWNAGTPVKVGDYFLPGAPEEGFTVEWTSAAGGERTFNNYGRMNTVQMPTTSVTNTSSGSTRSAVWTTRPPCSTSGATTTSRAGSRSRGGSWEGRASAMIPSSSGSAGRSPIAARTTAT